MTQNQAAAALKRTQPDTMRAAVIAEPGKIDIVSRPVPQPASRQALVRVEGCGVCASKLDLWQGQPWFTYPIEAGKPGHEGWGVIEELGDEVKGLMTGERVAFLSDGAFAEYAVVDRASVLHIPDSLCYQDLPAEPLGCA